MDWNLIFIVGGGCAISFVLGMAFVYWISRSAGPRF